MNWPKIIWYDDQDCSAGPVKFNSDEMKYVRADLVDGLVNSVNQFKAWAESQYKAQSKGAHETFDMLMLRNQVEMAETALAALKEEE